MRYAILIDAAFLAKRITTSTNPLTKDRLKKLIDIIKLNDVISGDVLYRIYYYDAEPCDKIVVNPLDGTSINLKHTSVYTNKMALLNDIRDFPMLALRLGDTLCRGYTIKKIKKSQLNTPIIGDDLKPNITQKGVDMKIGLDIATLSLKKLVDKIILIAGDTDFIPVLKFARSEGLQVFIDTLGNPTPISLKEHTDMMLNINYRLI